MNKVVMRHALDDYCTFLVTKVFRPELVRNIQKCDEELVKTEKQIRDSQTSRDIIIEKTRQIQNTVTKIRNKAKEIASERDRISGKLQDKETECQLLYKLRELQEKQSKQLEKMIEKKEKKIKELEKELQKKESELDSAQEHIKALQRKLKQAQEELKKEQEVMEKLRSKREKLADLCDLARQHLGNLAQRAVEPTSEVIFKYTPVTFHLQCCIHRTNRLSNRGSFKGVSEVSGTPLEFSNHNTVFILGTA